MNEDTDQTGWHLLLLSIDCVEDGEGGEDDSEGHGEGVCGVCVGGWMEDIGS